MTQEEKCLSAVFNLEAKGFRASHIQGAPDDHGVWLDGVWNDELQDSYSFRLHDEEIEFWS